MPTGVGILDVALGGGIPRGRITEVVGMRGAGKTALLRQVVSRVLRSGSWVAWVDARRTLAPQPWAELGARLVMIRPREAKRGAWCADLLLRSGVFALVVLDGAPLLSRVNGVRLAQLARERDAALVVIADGVQPSRVGGAVRLRVAPTRAGAATPIAASATIPTSAPPRRRSTSAAHAAPGPLPGFVVTVEKGGVFRTVEVCSAVVVARRVCTDPEIPDRRGVARGTRHSWTPHSHATTDGHTAHPITWGGLGASIDDPRNASPPSGDTTRPAVLHPNTDPAHQQIAHQPFTREQIERRHERDLDRRTRDWASAKGRRRAAESGYGRRSRRDVARERAGALITSHSGQSLGSNGTPRLGRDGGTTTLGIATLGNTPGNTPHDRARPRTPVGTPVGTPTASSAALGRTPACTG